jgi:hypothetical protein
LLITSGHGSLFIGYWHKGTGPLNCSLSVLLAQRPHWLLTDITSACSVAAGSPHEFKIADSTAL